ncbi:MAG: tape measure protein [Alphaproteobacteria bacterium]
MSDITLGITLTGDAGQFSGVIKLAREDLSQLQRTAEQAARGVDAEGAATGRAAAQAGAASRSLAQQAAATGNVGRAARAAGTDVEHLNRNTRQAALGARLAGSAFGELRGVLAAYLGLRGATAIIGEADAWRLLEGRVRNVTDSEEEAAHVQERLFEVAQESRAELDATVTLYERVARSRNELGRGFHDILQFTESINKLAVISRAAPQEARNAIIQLSQGLASGELRGEELRSVMEQLPEVARAIADNLGVGIGKLREMAEAGELTSKVVFDAILAKSEEIEQEFQRVPVSIGQAAKQIGNAFQKEIGERGGGAAAALADSIQFVARNFGDLTTATLTAAYAIGTVYVARALGPAIAGTWALVAAKGASIAALTAEQRMFIAGAAASQASTIAMMGLRGAMSFLGGPIGLAVTAVAAGFALLASNVGSAAEAQDRYNRTAGATAEILLRIRSQTRDAGAELLREAQERYAAIATEIERLEATIAEKQATFEAHVRDGGNAVGSGTIDALREQLAALRKERDELSAGLDELRTRRPDAGPPPEIDKKYAKTRDGLEAEIDALNRLAVAWKGYGDGVAEAEIRNEIDAALREANVTLMSREGQEIVRLIRLRAQLTRTVEDAEEADRRHRQAAEDIAETVDETLPTAYERAAAAARRWRAETLAQLDPVKEDYEALAAQVEHIYQHRMKEAQERALEDSREWSDGMKRGLRDYAREATDAAKAAEQGIASGFRSAEDALVSFVTKGKLEIGSLVDSIVADFARIAIRQNITGPLAQSLSGIDWSTIFVPETGNAGMLAHSGRGPGENTGNWRHVHPAVFADAPRFHSGRLPGLMPGELPAIIREEESVLTPAQMRAMGGPREIVLRIIDGEGKEVPTRERTRPGGGAEFEVMLDQITARNISRRGSASRQALENLGAAEPLRGI